ncbi:chromate resistance protein [Paracoccus sp. WLY502]|uniref:chromate resistance protein ChrB domain-containing protein n=1 Tax=Paracoccus yibinensis TaxID=3068891 RepID=UPI0027969304|nr:chromate resistance protein ChrB domain-containing protein [Paracoccus sp. WLY502]MDQ1901914.1 chromate resistance protein [Paracoccus sp. WLY502]
MPPPDATTADKLAAAAPWSGGRAVPGRSRLASGGRPAEYPKDVDERHRVAPFGTEGVFFSPRGELCSFDAMLAGFGLSLPALDRLAAIVRCADAARLAFAPEGAGLLAVSRGLSRLYGDDLEQSKARMLIHDALHRRAWDATHETHNWPSARAGAAP